ncbi:diguanylate cyclase domain-containing protein [Aliikangiella sp. IMCC44653]
MVVLTLGATVSIEYFHSLHHKQNQQLAVDKAQEVLTELRVKFENEINSGMFLSYSLAAYITVNPNSSQLEWEKLSEELVRNGRHIRNIGIAPDLIINYVYPLKGNEKAVGLNYRTTPSQWPAVEAAIKAQKSLVAGPLTLAQGGQGMIIRTPIFTDPPLNNELWGMLAVVMDIDSLYKGVELDSFSQDFSIAIKGKDGKGTQGELIYGDLATFQQGIVKETVKFPFGEWVLSGTPSQQQASVISQNMIRIVAYPILLIALVIISIVSGRYSKNKIDAMRDPLTDLANRRLLNDRIEHAMHYHKRKKLGFSLINIDLNGFKPINDKIGHEAGDAVLMAVAQRLKDSTRGSDTVARSGGDEFIILLPETSDEIQIRRVIQKVHDNLSKAPFVFNKYQLKISASVGWSIYPIDSENRQELLHIADKRMYKNKFSQKEKRVN